MKTRIVIAALLLACGSSLAAAQSSTAVPAAKPTTAAPAAATGNAPNGQQKVQIPPAARSGEKGLPGVMSDEPMEIKREK